MNPITTRLLSQQLAAPEFDSPAEVVSYFGAMQAQEYRQMRWAVGMRTRKPSAASFKRAFDSGEIVRLHLLRGTWQLVSREDYPWMMQLFAGRARTVINGWMRANGISLEPSFHERVEEIFSEAAGRLGSVTKEDLAAALEGHSITMDDHRLSYHIRYAELSGLLVSGDLLPMKATYALASEKLRGGGVREAPSPGPEWLTILARKYFQSHSPATLEDYCWWSGLSQRECKRGIEALGDELRVERCGGREWYVHTRTRTSGARRGALLIPAYDEYLIGYKSRDVVLDPAFAPRAHNTSGNFNPIIALGGRICGNWSPFRDSPEPSWFTESHDEALLKEWKRYQRFLGSGESSFPLRNATGHICHSIV